MALSLSLSLVPSIKLGSYGGIVALGERGARSRYWRRGASWMRDMNARYEDERSLERVRD